MVTLVVSRPISSDAVDITFMRVYPPSSNQALVWLIHLVLTFFDSIDLLGVTRPKTNMDNPK